MSERAEDSPTLSPAADHSLGAGQAPRPSLEWTVNPWRENWRRALLGVLFTILIGGVFLRASVMTLTAVALWLVFMFTLSPAFWVLRCRVDESGVARRLLFVWDRRPWSRIGRARLYASGLWVSPAGTPGWLETFRGLWLPLRGGASTETARLRAELVRRLGEHGL
jgi:hypothetical protein